MTALTDLLAAVEAGTDRIEMLRLTGIWAYGHGNAGLYFHAFEAYAGSLDAARALHDAVLPGWSPSIGQNAHHGYWFAHLLMAENGSIVGDFDGSSPYNPARAWLIAILRGLIAQEQASPAETGETH